MLKLAPLNPFGSSSDQIDIETIEEGVIKLPGNSYRAVLMTNSINFELKSEEEQDTLIDIFEGILNSIGFAIQLLIRTREIDMDRYLEILGEKIDLEQTTIYKTQLRNYKKFISALIESNKILNRHFYIIISLDSVKTTDKNSINDQLGLRQDIVTKNLARLGISCRKLDSMEVIDLFYSFYSPIRSKLQPISEEAISAIGQEFVEARKS